MTPTGGGSPAAPWRDPWAWAVLLPAIPIVLHALGTPLGEPFADDLSFLRRALLPGPHSWLDGGGSPIYWRPISRQLYFGMAGPLMVSHPGWIAALHVVFLLASALLIYRAMLRRWPASWCAAAASFPLLLESDRMLIAWPSHFQDIGALLFAAIALHEASRARTWSMLAAFAASLLCKEVGALTGLLLPWLPTGSGWTRRARWRATAMVAAVTLAWGLAYRALAAQGAVGLGYHAAGGVASPPAPIFTRLAWVFAQSARSAFSLPPERGPLDGGTAIVLGLLLAIACVLLARSRAGVASGPRARLRMALPLVLWGAAWWVASSVPLVDVHPLWSGQRGLYGSVGLGVALTGLLASAHPLLLVALIALRLCTFAMSPVGPAGITAEPPAGAEGQFPHVARLQRMARETRTALRDRFPSLPRGSIVGQHNMPALSRHAFAGDAALQVWYRDSTLRWSSFDDFHRHPETPLAAFVEYQPRGARPIALVEVEAMRGLLASEPLMGAARWAEAIATLERADSLQRDPAAAVFLAQTAGHRAECQMMLGQVVAAEATARRALGLWPEIPYARSTLAQLWMAQGRWAEAKSVLEMQLRLYPDDQDARALVDQLARAGAAR